MNWLVFGLVLLPILIALGWFAWVVLKPKLPKFRVNVYERLNDSYFFKESFFARLKSDRVLGEYLELKAKRFKMAEPSSDEVIPARSFNVVNVAKYGVDDYRPIAFLKGQKFYSKVKEPVVNTMKVPDRETGEEILVKVPVTDADDKPVFKDVEKVFVEPLAVTQKDKEVIRFNREYIRRMEAKRRSQDGFWKQNAPMVISSVIVAVCIIGMIMFMRVDSKSDAELQKIYIDAFGDYMDESLEAVNSPNFVNKIIENFDRNKMEANAPIS